MRQTSRYTEIGDQLKIQWVRAYWVAPKLHKL
jgi:hypothetical protein